jgi:hypothetical protein
LDGLTAHRTNHSAVVSACYPADLILTVIPGGGMTFTKCVTIINPVNSYVSAYWKKNGVDQFRTNLPPESNATFCFTNYLSTDVLAWGYDPGMQFVGYSNNIPNFTPFPPQEYTGNNTNSETNTISQQQVNATNSANNGYINFGGSDEKTSLQAGFNEMIKNQQLQIDLANQQNALLSNQLNQATNQSDGDGIPTNSTSGTFGLFYDTNNAGAFGVATQVDGFLSYLPGTGMAIAEPDDEFWRVRYGEGQYINFNPVSNAVIAPVISGARSMALWIVRFVFLMHVIKLGAEYLRSLTNVNQLDLFADDTLAKIVATGWGVTVVAGIIAAIIFIFKMATDYLVNWIMTQALGFGFSDLSANPFSLASGVVGLQKGLSLANSILPLQESLSLAVTYVTFRLGLVKVFFFAANLIRCVVR